MLSIPSFLRRKADKRIEIVRGALDPETLQTIETDVIRSGDNARADMEAARNAGVRANDLCNALHDDMTERAWKSRQVGLASERIIEILQRGGDSMVGDLMAEARKLAEVSEEISGGVNKAVARLETLSGAMHVISVTTTSATEEIDGMISRFVAGMRQNQAGDRRGEDRYPLNVQVEVIDGNGRGYTTRTVDVSRGGALVATPNGFVASPGMPLTLSFADVGRAEAIVTGISPLGVHCRFDAPMEERAGFIRLVASVETDYYERIDRATNVAAEAAAKIESAVSRGELSELKVFDDAYTTGEGGLRTESGAFISELLAPILDSLLTDPETVTCLLVDRNGLVVSDAIAPCRAWTSYRGKILADRPGIVAARSSRPFVLQAHSAMGPEPRDPLREISVPLRIYARHWGALRLILSDRRA